MRPQRALRNALYVIYKYLGPCIYRPIRPVMYLHLFLPSFQKSIVITAVGLLSYALVSIIYNLYLHPLARFPGPRGAASTRWWLAYWELGRGVSLSTLRDELHKKYGDIVRIAPNELHFAKPSVYNEIYNPQNKWDKDYTFYRAFDLDESFFSQTEYLKSKHTRTLVSNLFSKSAVIGLQHLIRGHLDRFCDMLKEQSVTGKSCNLYLGFQCFAADTICNYLFATDFDQLSYPGFKGELVMGVDKAMATITLAKFSVFFVWMIRYFPPTILMLLAPSLKGLVVYRRAMIAQVKSVLKNPNSLDDAPHRVIYSELLNPEAIKGLPSPTEKQLDHEARVLFAAGSHTIGTTLMIGVHYILRHPEVKERLLDEVRAAWPVLDQVPNYEELEKLPYLTAVIKETLRIATPTPAGLPRVVPPSGAMISGVQIPGGTVVSQSPTFVSFSEDVFERPREYLPDRWLKPESKALESWIVVFSKGPRSCLGINLAYCELYLTLAHLFRRFDIREDPKKRADLTYSEHFLAIFGGEKLHAYCDPRSE